MRLWRLARWPYRALDGEGGRLHGARWHHQGRPVIYTASRLSLCALELLVHLDSDELPDDLHAFEIDVPDELEVEQVAVGALPPGWDEPDSPLCRVFGDAWLAAGRTLALQVPSAIVPEELNCLLNPRHPAAVRIRRVSSRPFSFDARLLR